jgi:2-C-methyl-D-erythritol 2,4-cyclodiphosphate synthase
MKANRVGIGYDIHRLDAGDGIMLAGVCIPCSYRVVAHSDGDVVLHALCDALLGAVAAGDIGEHFPDRDPHNAGRDSREFIKAVLMLPQLQDWRIENVDVNIIAEAPRLETYKPAMRSQLADLLGLSKETVSIKARSNEGCDAIGGKQAIAAQAVVLLTSR